MKKIVKLIGLFSLVFVFFSCEMDLVPTDAIELADGFKTFEDAGNFANGLNSKFRRIHYGFFSYTTEVQGDMFNAGPDFGNRNGSPHRLDASFTPADYNLRDVWRPTYNLIMETNNFLANIALIDVEDENKAKVNEFKGNAHFYRAFAYHELVRRFAKSYDPATAETDLGVPLVLVYSVIGKPARATVAEVYAQIEFDIEKAAEFLSSKSGKVRSTVPTIDAVNALDARVKFYMHKYAEAATIANNLITSGKYTLATDDAEMTKEFVEDNGTESIMQMGATLTEWGGSANDIYLNYVNATSRYRPDFIPTQTCIDMYDATDIRRTNWFIEFPVKFSVGETDLTLFAKYPGNPDLFTAPSRNYRHKVKVFRIAEMYLIRAEALLSQPAPNAGDALVALNELQTARKATLSTVANMDEVKKEWAKETIGEGFRVDCLRRWKDGFSGRAPQDIDYVQVAPKSDYIEIVVNPNNDKWPKLTWAMPQSDISVNANLVQNPGW